MADDDLLDVIKYLQEGELSDASDDAAAAGPAVYVYVSCGVRSFTELRGAIFDPAGYTARVPSRPTPNSSQSHTCKRRDMRHAGHL